MTELFHGLPESKSPRLLWMERHGVSARINPSMSESELPYEAYTGTLESAIMDVAENGDTTNRMAYGETEHEAIATLAKRNGWKLWNEEGLAE